MNYFDAVVLGLVQGLTEFLPVSSSGHLVMAQAFLGVSDPGVFLEVALHVATLISVMVVYRKKILELLIGIFRRDAESLRYSGLLILATIPVVIIGLAFGDQIEAAFDTPHITGFMLLVTGLLLWSTKWGEARAYGEPQTRNAVAMGLTQCLALMPGISRSGSTIAAGLWTGLKGEAAAEFSFLMSLIAVGGAAVRQTMQIEGAVPITGPLIVGFLVALFSGIAAIISLVWLVKRQAFHHFAWYVWAAGLFFLGYLYLG